MERNMRFVVCFLLCSMIMAGHAQAKNVVSEGVFIDGIDFSGLTGHEAVKAEENYLKDLAKTKVTVTINGE